MRPTNHTKTRRVFGRLSDVDVGEGRFRFELTKAGLVVHRKNTRTKGDLTVPFSRLTEGGGHEWFGPDGRVRFAVTEAGVEVRKAGSRRVQVVPFPQVANMAENQPLLFV